MSKPPIRTVTELEDHPLELSYEQVEYVLSHGMMQEEIGLMRWGSNYTFLVRMLHEDMTFLAVYKPRLGERPLWDFPDGTLCQREAAAYVLSDALGWHLVPPTLLRDGTRGMGSVQVFIDHDPERHYFTFDEAQLGALQRMALFDVIANNADRKGGHCLLDVRGRVWGIDHGLTFNVVHKLRTVIWDFAGQAIADDLLADVEGLCVALGDSASGIYERLCALLDDVEMNALVKRVDALLAKKIYPMPGAGPNRPWPAV